MFNPLRRAIAKEVEASLDRIRRHPLLGEVYEAVDGTIVDYARDHGPMYAGALAFYTLLSLIPLVILLASLLGSVLASGDPAAAEAALDRVVVHVRTFIPYLSGDLDGDLRAVLQNRRGFGVVGVFGLLLASSQVFRAVEFAFARTFARLDHKPVDERRLMPRNYLKSKLWFGAFVTAIVLAVVAARLVLGLIKNAGDVLGVPEGIRTFLADPFAGSTVVSAVATALVFVGGYVVVLKFFVQRKVEARFAFIGGALFYVTLRSAHAFYEVYLQHFANIGALYGGFATLIVVVLWIYVGATLFLFCGHVTKMLQRRVLHGPRWPKNRPVFVAEEPAQWPPPGPAATDLEGGVLAPGAAPKTAPPPVSSKTSSPEPP